MSKGGKSVKLNVIEAERVRRDISKDEFAKIMGVSKRTLNNWRNGSTEMPLSKLMLLSKLWGCTIDYLLGLTDRAG